MYFTIVIDDDLVIIDGVAAKVNFNKDNIPDWVEIIWWDGEKGMLQHRDTTKSVPIDNYDDYQSILEDFYKEISSQKNINIKTKEQLAREQRDYVRRQTDVMHIPTYTISNKVLTRTQRKQLETYCLELANWPQQTNWPSIDFPVPSEWLKTILDIPEWKYS